MTWLIGFTYKHGNMFSGEVLIIRGLTNIIFLQVMLASTVTSLWLDYIIALQINSANLYPQSQNICLVAIA
jgi:hypothetical protein